MTDPVRTIGILGGGQLGWMLGIAARRLGLDCGRLIADAPADLVLFDPDAPFILDRSKLRSKSKNTPFDGARLQGTVAGTWVAGRRVDQE